MADSSENITALLPCPFCGGEAAFGNVRYSKPLADTWWEDGSPVLEAGCEIAQVGAITGQSFRVIEHYARGINGRRMGEAAILKFEGRAKK